MFQTGTEAMMPFPGIVVPMIDFQAFFPGEMFRGNRCQKRGTLLRRRHGRLPHFKKRIANPGSRPVFYNKGLMLNSHVLIEKRSLVVQPSGIA